jgi:5-methylthioadenosine/S-adenosylhomocysteine deaminase
MSILIKDATILTQDAQRRRLHGDVYIEDQMITQVSEKPVTVEADYRIDGRKKLLLPGLINLHTHLPMTLLRGYGDDMQLQEWLQQRIWPVEARLTAETIASGAALGALEMIASGTTAFLDMYFFEETVAEVIKKSGLRGFLGFGVLDFDTAEYKRDQLLPACERFVKDWHRDPMVHPVVAPHSAYTCKIGRAHV